MRPMRTSCSRSGSRSATARLRRNSFVQAQHRSARSSTRSAWQIPRSAPGSRCLPAARDAPAPSARPRRCPRRGRAEQVSTRGVQPSAEAGNRCSAPAYSHARPFGLRPVVAVGLVDGHAVDHLDDAALHALQLVARAGQHQQQEEIGHRADRGFALAHARRFPPGCCDSRPPRTAAWFRACGAPRRPGGLRDGEGRMKARSSTARRSMRVLSPRMLPPETGLDGSTLSTATFSPRSRIRCMPRASMKVLLPTPGTPVIPTRSEWPVCGSRRPAGAPPVRRRTADALDQRDGAGEHDAVAAPARLRCNARAGGGASARSAQVHVAAAGCGRIAARTRSGMKPAGYQAPRYLHRTRAPDQRVQDLLGGHRDHRAGAEYIGHARLEQAS